MIKMTIAATVLLTFCALAEASNTVDFPMTPNPEMTTGDYCTTQDPNFMEYRYIEHIVVCRRNVSSNLKNRIYRAYGVPDQCHSEFTIDHLVPLSMGGSNSVKNLWPEHKHIKATRQNMEQDLYDQLAAGKITREQAVTTLLNEKMNPPPVAPSDCY